MWAVFDSLCNKISDFHLTVAVVNNVFDEGKAWIDLFCSLRGERPGYTRARITPYMHTIAYHLHFFVQKHGCLKTFTVEEVEKNNFFFSGGKQKTNEMLRNTFSVQKVFNEFSSTAKGRNLLTPKKNGLPGT